MCQINWWMPIFDVSSDNTMAFHPNYWSEPVANDSADFNYYEHNRSRGDAAKFVKSDPRTLPSPQEAIEIDPQIRIVVPTGGVVLFSGAHLHSSVPNSSGRTRFSTDFRVIHLDDANSKIGAPNIDSNSTGTTMRDYLNASDHSQVPDSTIELYDDGTEKEFLDSLVFKPR